MKMTNEIVSVLRYLNGMLDVVLTIKSDGLNISKWWVNSSFAIHKDVKIHTDGTMRLVKALYTAHLPHKRPTLPVLHNPTW